LAQRRLTARETWGVEVAMRRVCQCIVGVLVVILTVAGCTVITQMARNKEAQSMSAQPTTTDTTTSTTDPTQPTSTSSTGHTTSTESSQPADQPVTRLELAGSGSKTTEKFTVGPEWTVEWSYECTGQFASAGLFNLIPKGSDAVFLLPVMPNPGPKAADTQHYHEAGEFYLDVLSTCDWNIVVRG
jgi:hypothetical protein